MYRPFSDLECFINRKFSLLIGANIYYFKPYNGWSLSKTVTDYSSKMSSFRPGSAVRSADASVGGAAAGAAVASPLVVDTPVKSAEDLAKLIPAPVDPSLNIPKPVDVEIPQLPFIKLDYIN